jgi:hypothetical protein
VQQSSSTAWTSNVDTACISLSARVHFAVWVLNNCPDADLIAQAVLSDRDEVADGRGRGDAGGLLGLHGCGKTIVLWGRHSRRLMTVGVTAVRAREGARRQRQFHTPVSAGQAPRRPKPCRASNNAEMCPVHFHFFSPSNDASLI